MNFRYLPRFLCRTDGATTVDAILWLPFFVMVFGLILNVSMVFNGQARALRVIQDANRQMSVGQIATSAAIESHIQAELASISIAPTLVRTTVDAGVISTLVRIPARQLSVLGFTDLGIEVSVVADMMIENWEI